MIYAMMFFVVVGSVFGMVIVSISTFVITERLWNEGSKKLAVLAVLAGATLVCFFGKPIIYDPIVQSRDVARRYGELDARIESMEERSWENFETINNIKRDLSQL